MNNNKLLISFALVLLAILLFAAWYSHGSGSSLKNQDKFGVVLSILHEAPFEVSFRGISHVDDSIIWVSGSESTVGFSSNYGASWRFIQIPGIDSLQLRDIHAFDSNRVLVLGSGHPTRIFKTENSGKTWKTVYTNNDERMFLDGFDFWKDGAGIAYGDPIDGNWTIMQTNDYGSTWTRDTVNSLSALDGEAGFAASGTGIICVGDSLVLFGSGGIAAHMYYSRNRGRDWKRILSPMISGRPSQGIFSVSYHPSWSITVGGDYAIDTSKSLSASVFSLQDEKWHLVDGLPYQSVVQIINDSIAVSGGTPGCFVTVDQGITWEKISDQSVHTLSTASQRGELFWAGADGKIGIISIDKR